MVVVGREVAMEDLVPATVDGPIAMDRPAAGSSQFPSSNSLAVVRSNREVADQSSAVVQNVMRAVELTGVLVGGRTNAVPGMKPRD